MTDGYLAGKELCVVMWCLELSFLSHFKSGFGTLIHLHCSKMAFLPLNLHCSKIAF